MEYNRIYTSLEQIKFDQARNAKKILKAIAAISLPTNPMENSDLEPDPMYTDELNVNPAADKSEKWLLTEDLTRIFKKSLRTIYTWRRDGKIPFAKIGRTIYYNQRDVDKLLSEGQEAKN